MSRIHVLTLTAAAALLAAIPASAEDLDQAIEKLAEAQARLKTWSAKFTATSQVSRTMKYEMKGTYEWMRSGDKVHFRQDVKRKATHDLDGEQMVVDEDRTTLADGAYHYQINNETKNVLKQDFDPESSEALDVRALVSQLQVHYDELKLLPGEKVGEHGCVVFEGSGTWMEDDPDDPMINVHREVIWFDQDSGMPVKFAGYDKSGQVVREKVFSEIRKDAKLDPERFRFKLEGANVADHTGR